MVESDEAACFRGLDKEAKNQVCYGRVRWGRVPLVWTEKPKIKRTVLVSDGAACPRFLDREAENQVRCGMPDGAACP